MRFIVKIITPSYFNMFHTSSSYFLQELRSKLFYKVYVMNVCYIAHLIYTSFKYGLNTSFHYFFLFSVLPQYECSLNCEAVGGGFYARLNETVIDGTSCSNPAKIYGKRSSFGALSVCVDGYCQVSTHHSWYPKILLTVIWSIFVYDSV